MRKAVQSSRVVIPIHERRNTADGFYFATVKVGSRTAIVTLELDLEEMFRYYAARALRSKSGRATALSGLLVARVDQHTITESRDEEPATNGRA